MLLKVVIVEDEEIRKGAGLPWFQWADICIVGTAKDGQG